MNRRQLLAATALASAPLLLGARAAAKRPNFIVIQCDDLGYGDIGGPARGMIRTPHLDRMAREGTRFSQFYAGANICTPARAAVLTGRYAVRTGLGAGVLMTGDKRGLPLDEITIAEALKPAGYRSALVGKWHLGHVPPYWPPTVQGFDYFFGLPYSHDMKPLALFEARPETETTSEPVDYPMLQQRFVEKALAFIDADRATPFFLDLALSAPHLPNYPNPAFAGRSKAGAYGDVVEEIDAIVGRLLDHLRALGIDRDTLVLFTSDNGPWFEGSAGGLRQRKGGGGYDGAQKVPMIAWQPRTIPAGRVCDSMLMSIDFLPTFCAMAHIPPPAGVELDGLDVSAVLTRSAASPHDALILFDDEDPVAIRSQKWKYVAADYYHGYNLSLEGRGYPQLYDMTAPTQENYSVAEKYPAIVTEMEARLDAARQKFAPFRKKKSSIVGIRKPAD